jgi:hypothetical protein
VVHINKDGLNSILGTASIKYIININSSGSLVIKNDHVTISYSVLEVVGTIISGG